MSGNKIDYRDGKISVPDDPIILFIEGDGTGPDIWRATKIVLDAAVEKTYGGKEKDTLAGGPGRREVLQPDRGMAAPGYA
jgi:isocitrate dehydrogenase